MKLHSFIVSMLLCSMVLSCSKHEPKFDKDISLIVDKSDTMTAYPSAEGLILLMDLEQHPWQAIRVTIQAIAASDIPSTVTLILPGESEWSGNATIRKAKIKRFEKKLRAALAIVCIAKSDDHSILYRNIAKAANQLAASDAPYRSLIIASDLKEHSDVNFYAPATIALLRNNPKAVQLQLEHAQPLNALTGVEVSLLYNPKSYEDNNKYMTLAHFYEQVFSSHHATTHLINKL